MTARFLETAISVKLYFPEGEIDFIASAPLTARPSVAERILGRKVRVETTAEIMAKKAWHRGKEFTARDYFDLALVATRDPDSIEAIRPILRKRRAAILARLSSDESTLRTTFSELDVMGFRPSFDECIRAVLKALGTGG